MKRTLATYKLTGDGWQFYRFVTCEVVGEMDDGTKVWEDSDGNQYQMIKDDRRFIFITF